MSAISTALITRKGLEAIQVAQRLGRDIKIKEFGFSEQDIALSIETTSADVTPWVKKDFDYALDLGDFNTEWAGSVEANKTIAYTRIVFFYLEDGTLFLVGKLNNPMLPYQKHTFKMQVSLANYQTNMDFLYVSQDYVETVAREALNAVNIASVMLRNALDIHKIHIEEVK